MNSLTPRPKASQRQPAYPAGGRVPAHTHNTAIDEDSEVVPGSVELEVGVLHREPVR